MSTPRQACVVAASVLIFGFASAAQAEAPTFDYETAVPGYYLASGQGMTVDNDGNAYVFGKTYEDHVHLDILVMKFDPDGALLWTQYIVGNGHDWATDVTLDDVNNVYLTGWTDSEDFPIVNGLDSLLTGFREAFVMKLSTVDGSILYSTFLGGDYTDEGHGIALDDAGDIIVVGTTGSTDFPTTEDAYQDHPSAPLYIYTDVFVTKLSAAGDAILYSTYFGGFEDDAAAGMALDGNGNIVFAGTTTADDFPLENPIDSVPNEIFVSKLSADGSTLLFSTYFGGGDWDRLGGLAMDSGDDVCIAGSTRSTDLPTTPGAFQTDFVGGIYACGSPPFDPLHNCEDAYVAKLRTDGAGLVYCSYLGGSSVDECRGITVGGDGSVHLVGNTTSLDFPGSDEVSASIFVSKLVPDGSDLVYTLTKPSGSANAGHGIAVDGDGDVYFAGAINVPADLYVAKTTGWRSFTAVPENGDVRGSFHLGTSAPNPFAAATVLSYALPDGSDSPARLSVYDVSGRRVRTLMEGSRGPGVHTVTWDGTDDMGRRVTSGVYFYRLEWNGQSRIGRTVLVR